MASPESRAARRVARSIVERLVKFGHTAYFAGGCVRDELLGLEPKDYDVATDARPERVAELFRRTREVGKSFGVMHVYDRGHTVEVATFRKEAGYSDRRRPDHVTFTDAEHDARRRDFTINALFIDPLDESDRSGGRVIDHVEGQRDLEAGLVRAVGDPDERLDEDHLRALRAVRFTARLAFELEPGTAAAVRRHARELRGVSRERVGEECRGMLGHARRASAVSLMQVLGLDGPALDDEPCPGAGVARLESLPGEASFPFALAAWMLDRLEWSRGAPPDAEAVSTAAAEVAPRWRDALCLTNEERSELRGILEMLGHIERAWGGWGVARRKRAATAGSFEQAVHLLGVRDADGARRIRAEVRALAADGIGLSPEPLITGDDLIEAGLTPGPMFGRWLDRAYDLQLAGEVGEKDGALALVRSWAGGEGSGD